MAEEIICLGKKFGNEDERREYFRNELRKKLPELKKIDGFPISEDEDIISLSDPPYFTFCPNPWINEFIENIEKENLKATSDRKTFRINEPYGYDIREGVNNPVYNSHSYHTKVPHPAIMRFILHYTRPGDIIIDSFAGTGMCGVAANSCENPDQLTKLKIETEWKSTFGKLPSWGKRNAIVSDLSPLASFISYNLNSKVDLLKFSDESDDLLLKIENDFKWMFETWHKPNTKGKINYVVWSECLICPNCSDEIVLYKETVEQNTGKVQDSFYCPTCKANLIKGDCEKSRVTEFDNVLSTTITKIKYVPVRINYSVGTKRYTKSLDENDFKIIKKIDEYKIDSWIPIDEIRKGDKSGDPFRVGIHYVHQFYSKRNLIILSKLFEFSEQSWLNSKLKFIITSMLPKLTNMNRYMPQHGSRALVGPMANTLYIPSFFVENNSIDQYVFQRNKIFKAFKGLKYSIGSIHSATKLPIKDSCVDYIFTDPPFGSNIMYSELNFIAESWLKIKTNNNKEAIQNKTQGKNAYDYQHLMTESFIEYYRVLKPGKWMTVEFSNTSAGIWNAIQNAIQRAGFIISSVTAIDNNRGGLHAMIGPTAVKQNLIISCYKLPEDKAAILNKLNEEVTIWEFIEMHLTHIPVHLKQKDQTLSILERNPKVLYDRLISYFILRGFTIPIDAKEFQEGLKVRFVERDGMYFTHEQAIDYDIKKSKAPELVQLSWQIATEDEGVEWLKRELNDKKLKYQDIHPKWMQAITAIRKGDILPELRDLLQQNFIEESDGSWRVPDMNEAKDREIIRNKALQKEFNSYVELTNNPKSRRMKEVRVEALRAGFKQCWDIKDFQTIVRLSDKIPQNLLLEDEQLLMYYDIAKDRI